MPDTDPEDEAELILTLPSPPLHKTHRLAEGDHLSLLLPEHSSTYQRDHQAVPEAPNIFRGCLTSLCLACTQRRLFSSAEAWDWTLDSFLQCVGSEQPSVYASPVNETGAPLTTQIVHITTRCPVTINRTRLVPSCGVTHGQPPLFSVSRQSLTLDGPSPCLTLTHRGRQRVSRHCPLNCLESAYT
jgi:hypothetical protein